MAKQEIIKHLTDVMGVICNAHWKGREIDVRVHESHDAAISIDLYDFGGTGEDVIEGLHGVTPDHGDGIEPETGWVFNIGYDPDDEEPLYFLFIPEDGDDAYTILPQTLPEDLLQRIAAWLEKAMVPKEPEKFGNQVTSFFYYMWNKWSEDECKVVFKDDYHPHFWNKWCEAYDTMKGPRGAAELFYMMLSDTNRDKLVTRALECYDGMTEK